MWVLQEELLGTLEVSSTDSIPAGFCSQKLWKLFFLALVYWAFFFLGGGRESGVGLGFLAPRISLPNFYPPHIDVGTSLFCVSVSPTSLDGCGFFNSIVLRLAFN